MASTVTLYEDENFGGDSKPDITTDQPDLTQSPINLTDGASSMKIGSNASKWDVFTEVNYHGVRKTLYPGKNYKTVQSMGLASPVYSMRKMAFRSND